MKKIITVLLMLLLVFSYDLSAGENPAVSNEVKHSFNLNFPRAKNGSFQVYGDAILVSYFESCRYNIALYKENGELIGTGSYINEEEIPSKHIRSLQKRFGAFEIVAALEFSTNDQSYYGLHIATEKENVLLKVSDSSYMEIVKRERRL